MSRLFTLWSPPRASRGEEEPDEDDEDDSSFSRRPTPSTERAKALRDDRASTSSDTRAAEHTMRSERKLTMVAVANAGGYCNDNTQGSTPVIAFSLGMLV